MTLGTWVRPKINPDRAKSFKMFWQQKNPVENHRLSDISPTLLPTIARGRVEATLAPRKHKHDAITLENSEVVLALAANTTAASSTARPVPGWKPGISRFLPKTSESADVFARNGTEDSAIYSSYCVVLYFFLMHSYLTA